MGIYIKGMEMPTNCSECAFCGYYGNGEHMCDIIQKAVEYESAKMSRLDDCPLVHVPEHGEMANADRIRAMSDEELADWIWGAETAGWAYGPRGKVAWLDWLKSPADKEGEG